MERTKAVHSPRPDVNHPAPPAPPGASSSPPAQPMPVAALPTLWASDFGALAAGPGTLAHTYLVAGDNPRRIRFTPGFLWGRHRGLHDRGGQWSQATQKNPNESLLVSSVRCG